MRQRWCFVGEDVRLDLTRSVTNVKFKEHAGVVQTWLYIERFMTWYRDQIFKTAQTMLLAKLGSVPGMELCTSVHN